MLYILRLKSGGEGSRVDAHHASNLTEARNFFMGRKQMDDKTFDKLYIITEETK